MGHGYTNPLAIVISYIDIIVTWMLGTQLCHVYTSRFHLTLVLHVHEALWYTYSPVYMHGLCLYSCHIESPCILHVLLFHVIPVFLVYDCFLLLIWIFPLLDMRAVDMRYVESHIYCSCFPLYCSCFQLYCSMLSTELWSSYHVTCIMYCICACYIVYLTYQIIRLTWVWGRLDGWLDLIGWCTGSILFSHCRGR